jgi:hypothetical protein
MVRKGKKSVNNKIRKVWISIYVYTFICMYKYKDIYMILST